VQAQPVEYQRVALWSAASSDAADKRMAMSVRFAVRQ
jgi:PhoPQ-activated pathogenicity-related protein